VAWLECGVDIFFVYLDRADVINHIWFFEMLRGVLNWYIFVSLVLGVLVTWKKVNSHLM